MRVDDWRNVPASSMAPIYDTERMRWRQGLQWNPDPSLAILEQARAAGTLPGLVVRGPGQSVVGWTYFIVHKGVLQVGALQARTADGVRLLLDAIFKAPEASLAHEVLLFVFPDSPACESALQRRRFTVTRYWYLRRMLERSCVQTPDARLRTLCDSDGPDLVRLLSRAYAGVPAARCFAPHGRLDEWAQYLGQLTHGQALGRFVRDASVVAPGGRASGLAGAAIVTDLAPTTLHLAQLAVDPLIRREGVARRMLDAMLGWGLAHGRSVATLLVSEDNVAARALYDGRGFLPTGYFLHAERPLGRRVVSPSATTVAHVHR